MPPLPLENNLFFSQVRALTAWCCSDTPAALHSVPEACWPQALGHIPLPAWPLLILGSRSSELSSCLLPACDGQHRDPPHHTPKEPPRQMALRQQQPVIAGVFHQASTGLHQPLLQAGQRPVLDSLGQRQPPP